mgnify:CR=1 FL=1
MQKIGELKRKIMKELEKENTISFKELYSRMNIKSYQERSNFLEALYQLQIEEHVYNPKKYIYKSFPKDTHKLEEIIKTDDGLILSNENIIITNDMVKCDSILDKDLVVVNLIDKENPIITKVVQRDITSFIDYLMKRLDSEELTYRQIKRMAVAKNAKSIEELHIALTELERNGKIFHDKNSYKKWPKGLTLTKLELNNKGRAFFKIDNKKVYPLGDELKGAIQQDILAVSRKGKHIEKIISRKMSHVVLEVIEIDGVKQLEPVLLPSKEKINVRISSKDMKGLAIGDRIIADVSLTKTDEYYEADFIDKLGRIDDPNIDIISIAAKYGFDINFSHEAMEEANNISQTVKEQELINRYDFSDNLLTFTIDCDETKDMDDAVSLIKKEDGHYILEVHIMDVAHYVKRGTHLDKEAYDRGLSTYPANTVIPALPHILSNGICSLNPNSKRLTKSIIMELDENGELINYNLVNSCITSKKKMAYSKVNKILDNEEIDDDYLPYVDNLKLMKELSDKLTAIREREGMLTFNEEEVTIIEDDKGNIMGIEKKDNGAAGKIIENYMIMANYCADLYLNFTIGRSIHRVHANPDPKRLEQAKDKLSSLGINLPKVDNIDTSSYLQTVLDEYKDSSEYPIVSEILLQALPRAIYSPYPLGHFGLGLSYYSHFTSPIRRYPDLKVQQIIDSYIANDLNTIESEEKLAEICEHCSFKERQADLLEKEVVKVKMMDYVDSHKEKTYYGTITGIDNERAYLNTVTHIPGYFEYEQGGNIRFIKSRNYIKNKDDEIILKIGDLVMVEGIEANRKELLAHFDFTKNLTLEQQNKKGATALKGQYVKKIN